MNRSPVGSYNWTMQIVSWILNIFVLLLMARILLSWVRVGYDSPLRPLADFVFRATEPVLAPVRNVLPQSGPFDFSPIIVFFAITLIRNLIT